ncbi:MAG: T9SS type A sorting domain-containing protein [Bacteroidia bacterium]
MKKTLILLLSVWFIAGTTHCLRGQVIWTEDFTYANGTTTGANNNTANPAPDWTASCATCLTGDWFDVQNNMLEGRDTNGPGILTTEVIDISSYPNGVEFSVDLSQAGSMEGCSGVSCGFNCLDWIKIEYSIDGGTFLECTHPNGGSCPGATNAPGDFVTMGDFTAFTYTQCPLFGNSLQIRLSCQNWAASEYHRFDNLVVQAEQCILFTEENPETEVSAIEPEKPLIYPNPFTDKLFVSVENDRKIREIVILDLLGKVHYQERFQAETAQTELSLSALSNQHYIYRIITDEAVFVGKLTKQQQ